MKLKRYQANAGFTRRSLSSEGGQVLLELIVALVVGGLIIGSVVALIAVLLRAGSENKNLQAAAALNQEIIEKVKVIAEAKWNDVYNLTPKGSSTRYAVRASGTNLVIYKGAMATEDFNLSKTIADPDNVVFDSFGNSVAIGDVNADGFADVLVGCQFCDSATGNTGKAFLYFGGPNGIDATVDKTFISPDNISGDNFGTSLAIGDVNADGFGDVLVGCQFCDSATSDTGKAFLFFGATGTTMDTSTDKTFISPDNVANDNFGQSVAIGEVNSDGFKDVLVGCDSCDNGVTADTGKAFLYFGASGTTMDTSTDKTFISPDNISGDNFGTSLAIGDVNGDGFGDVLAGCDSCNNITTNDGKAFLFFGAVGTTMDASADKTFTNPDSIAFSRSGNSVAIGDVNADGFADVLVGCRFCFFGAGQVLLYFGATGTTMDTSADQTFGSNGYFGISLAIGDVNGDGFGDVLVGCIRCSEGVTFWTGKALLFFGAAGTTMDASADKTFLNPDNDYGDEFGNSVAIGDVNGNGLSDVLVGCSGCNNGATGDTGKVFVFSPLPPLGFFTVENVCRTNDATSSITTVTPCSSGNVEDPSTQKITAHSQWTSAGKLNDMSLITYITRFKNFIFTQTNWEGGPNQVGPLTEPGAGFDTSTNLNVASGGAIKILGF